MQWHRRENLLKYTPKKKRPRDTGARKNQPPVETRPLSEAEWLGRKK